MSEQAGVELAPPEAWVLATLSAGHPCVFADTPPGSNAERTISAAFLRDLLIEKNSGWADGLSRLELGNAIIEGDLSLAHIRRRVRREAPPCSLAATACTFNGRLDLSDGRLETLHLDRCELRGGLVAKRLQVSSDFSIQNSTIHLGLDLERAGIEGLLMAEGCTINGPTNLERLQAGQINLDLATLSGPATLEMCRVTGTVALDGAHVDAGGQGTALSFNGAQIGGDLFMRSCETTRNVQAANSRRLFTVHGMVDAVGASIRGGVEIHDARIYRQNCPFALKMGRLETEGCFFLRQHKGFRVMVDGAIDLKGSRIAGYVRIEHADMSPTSGSGDETADGICLDLTGAKITSFLEMKDLTSPQGDRPAGEYRLTGAHVEMLKDDPMTAWPAQSKLELTGFTYDLLPPDFQGPERLNWILQQFQTAPSSNPQAFVGRLLWSALNHIRWTLSLLPLPAWIADEARQKHRRDRETLNQEYSPQPFEQLAAVLRKMGYDVEADHVAITNREMRTLCKAEAPWRRFLSAFMNLTSRYGYSPTRATAVMALYWLAGSVMLTAVLLFELVHLQGSGATEPTHVHYLWWFDHALRTAAIEGCPAAVTPLLVLDMIVPGLDLGQTDACRIDAKGMTNGFFTSALAAYKMLGGILAAITVTTYAGILRKE